MQRYEDHESQTTDKANPASRLNLYFITKSLSFSAKYRSRADPFPAPFFLFFFLFFFFYWESSTKSDAVFVSVFEAIFKQQRN